MKPIWRPEGEFWVDLFRLVCHLLALLICGFSGRTDAASCHWRSICILRRSNRHPVDRSDYSDPFGV